MWLHAYEVEQMTFIDGTSNVFEYNKTQSDKMTGSMQKLNSHVST